MTRRLRTFFFAFTIFSFLVLFPMNTLEVFGKRFSGNPASRGGWSGKSSTADDPESLRSSFRQGVEALNKGNPLIAVLILEGLEERYTVLGDYVLYYHIRAELENGDAHRSLFLSERFVKEYPESVLIPRVQLEMVKAFLSLKQFPAAATVAKDLLTKEKGSKLSRQASLLLGESSEGEEDWIGALDLYQVLAFEDPVTPEGLDAEQRITRIMEATGVQPSVPSDDLYLTRVKALNRALKFDHVIDVCEAFQERYSSGEPLDKALLLKARALIKKGKTGEGEKLYQRLSRSGSTEAIKKEAAYLLGSFYWNGHENSRAKRAFKRLIKNYPYSEWSLKARYALGRIYGGEKNTDKAREYFFLIGKVRPQHSLAATGAWWSGWAEYKAGRYEKARQAFDTCMQRYPGSDVFTDALYWKGRCEENLMNEEEAQKIFQSLAQDYSWDFYGISARKRLKSSWVQVPDINGKETGSDPIWNPEPLQAEAGSVLAYHRSRAEELIALRFFKEARDEIDALQSEVPDDPGALCYVGKLYERSRNYYESVRWMYRYRSKACGVTDEEHPLFIQRYLYPLAFWSDVNKEAEKNGLDPFLVLAVMRQESLYQQDVVSLADARGLMQIIPPTGEEIARQLEVADFTPEALFDPEKNIAFGAWYLKTLMKRSNGDLVRVLSSYNAGESRSDDWWDRFKHLDVDERIESITFRETRGYVKKVLKNLENYKRLYERHSRIVENDAAK